MLKRFSASYDTTITNAYKANLTQRGTGSNMGASDVLEVFSIYGQQATSSSELSRVLVQFPISEVSSSRAAGAIPVSGSASFYLRLFNAKHGQTLPYGYSMVIQAVSRSWSEGIGLDMEDYTDVDHTNWIYATSGTTWTSEGGDYHASPTYTASFDTGEEDIEVDVTELVEQWITGTKQNYGVGVRLSSSHESASLSYYTKKFFARGTQYFFKKPLLEVRWNGARKDSRGNFYASSSLLGYADNTQTLYFYNYVKGQLQNINDIGTGAIYMQMFTAASGGTSISSVVTGGYVATGIYTASLVLSTTASTAYDRWYSSGLSTCYYTGSAITIRTVSPSEWNPQEKWVTKITNLKPEYKRTENARMRVFTRKSNWNPTNYVVQTAQIRPDIVENGYWSLHRAEDSTEVVPFGTGSVEYTKMSYDISGSYFDLDMNMLEPDFSYRVKFAYYVNGNYEVQPEIFKFKVVS
jgi:hypothetical protein